MADRGQDGAEDSGIHLRRDLSKEWHGDVEDDEGRNSPSGPPGHEIEATLAFNPQILRRPSKQTTDSIEDLTEDAPLPVTLEVELDVAFEDGGGFAIPDLPYPSLDASLKSEAFDDIRRLILEIAANPHSQEVQFNEEEVHDDLFSSKEKEHEGQGRGLFAVDNLRFFLGSIRFDDVMMT